MLLIAQLGELCYNHFQMLPITGTFLDEISHDIPHQNWGRKEWKADFAHMQRMGINTVILIRCGFKKWQTFPCDVLIKEEGAYAPPVDLVQLFLEVAEEHEMSFYFGLFCSQ